MTFVQLPFTYSKAYSWPSIEAANMRQLNATEPWSVGGPAQPLISHFTHALASSRPGGTLPAAAGGVAEGVGAVAEEAAPLALAAL